MKKRFITPEISVLTITRDLMQTLPAGSNETTDEAFSRKQPYEDEATPYDAADKWGEVWEDEEPEMD